MCLFNDLNISSNELSVIARGTGFIRRVRKIDSMNFMYSIAMESMRGIVSYNDIAASIENDNGIRISRQAVCKKVTESCVAYFRHILELVIVSKVMSHHYKGQITGCKFKRVLIQDSTIIRLPQRLFESFSGVSNGTSTVCHARIQGVYDLLAGKFISFTINPYSKNDQACANEMEIRQDDLTLRDRGYLSVDELKRHSLSGAHCVYRHKMKMQLLDYDTEEPIDVLSLLKKEGSLDIPVRLNNKERTAIRLVARPVDQQTADNRRMRAKRDMKRHRPGKLFMELQSWTIFITTIPLDRADFDTLLEIYGLRWRIETIFKSWKTNLCFDNIHNVSKNQLTIILIARMIMFSIITQIVYVPCKLLLDKHMSRTLSLLKLTKYLTRNPMKFISLIKEIKTYHGVIGQSLITLGLYCVYDKRLRSNFDQKLDILFS